MTDDLVSPFANTLVRDPLLGKKVGQWVVRGHIGSGGMGIVYRAEQPDIGSQVAIKVLRPEAAESPEQVERFLREARALSQIRHPGVITVYQVGQLPWGSHYVAMELLDGLPLDSYLVKYAPIRLEEALRIIDEVASALFAAHAAGIVHRDLKPGNVFLVRHPSGPPEVKLLDFGLAKVLNGTSAAPLTRPGLALGTPEYMAPEQIRGEPVTPRADLYSLGVLAFEMITGRLPFPGRNLGEILSLHLSKAPPAPSQVLPELPPEIDTFLLALLEKDASRRPASADAVRATVAAICTKLSCSKTVVHVALRASSLPPAPAPIEAAPTVLRSAPTELGAPAFAERGRSRLYLAVGIASALLGAALLAWALRFS